MTHLAAFTAGLLAGLYGGAWVLDRLFPVPRHGLGIAESQQYQIHTLGVRHLEPTSTGGSRVYRWSDTPTT